MTTWTIGWPEEEGVYWRAYVSQFGKPYMEMVRVRYAGSGTGKFWMYVQNGGFVYPQEDKHPESTDSRWMKLEMPEPPPEIFNR